MEGLLASVVLAAAMVGIGTSLMATLQQSQAMADDSAAVLLARQLMEEVAAKPLLDPESGLTNDRESSRAAYDNVGDYDGYSDATSSLKSVDGTTLMTLPAGEVYVRSVKVVFRSSPSGADLSTGPMALATVRVTTPTGRPVELSRLVSRTAIAQ